MEKKIYKSRTDRQISGVCGGLAKYAGIDSTLIRLLWVFTVLWAGTGLILYLVCALIIPDEPVYVEQDHTKHTDDTETN